MPTNARTKWPEARLGDHATVKARLGWKGLKAEEYVLDGPIFLAAPNLKGNRIEFDHVDHIPEWRYQESPEIQLREGDILLVKDGSTLGISGIVTALPAPTTVNGSIAVIRPHTSLDSGFLFYFISGERFQKLIWFKRAGLGVPHLFQADLRKFEISVPSLSEQRGIAEILSTLDETIEQTETLIAKYQQIKAGLMHDLFTRGVTPDGKLRPTHTEAAQLYKESPLGWIPSEWEVKHLAELYGNPIRDFGSFSSTNLITFLESGVPFIKSEMIGVGKIMWDSVMFISEKVHGMLSKSHVQKGDILFSKIGSALGEAVVYDGSRGVCNSNAAIAKIDIDRRKATNFFVMYFLNHETAQTQFKNMIVSLLPRINLRDINRLRVPVPPLAEQFVIQERLISTDNTINAEEKLLDKQILIKHGLMHDLLTGCVRVKVAESEAA
jgi:type I restriction enzyme, S subunit